MDDVELFERMQEYDSEEDIRTEGGKYGIYLADCVFYRTELEDLRKWEMLASLSFCEKEALCLEAS